MSELHAQYDQSPWHPSAERDHHLHAAMGMALHESLFEDALLPPREEPEPPAAAGPVEDLPFDPPREYTGDDTDEWPVPGDSPHKWTDLTSQLLDDDPDVVGYITPRTDGVLCGLGAVEMLGWGTDIQHDLSKVRWSADVLARDGDRAIAGKPALRLYSPHKELLLLERTMLNMITFLSGIATCTRRFVDAVAGTPARIYDTRKTIPGYRLLSKYAVRCGGGCNHRAGLFDAVLVKDNHLADIPLPELPRRLAAWVRKAADFDPKPTFFEVEVDRLEQLDRVLEVAGVDIVLLDNFSRADLAEAVRRRNRAAPTVQLEASGGVNLDTVRAIAETGVDRIAIGAITHSAPALDVGLDVV